MRARERETGREIEWLKERERERRDVRPRCLWCGLMGRTGERVPQSCVSRIFDGEKREEATVRDKQRRELCLIGRAIGADRLSLRPTCLSLDVSKK